MQLKIITISLILLSCSSGSFQSDIDASVKGMEEAWRADDRLGIANYYSDDAFLLSPTGIAANGREEVNKYWVDFKVQPMDWELESILVTNEFEDVSNHARWKSVSQKIPSWEKFDLSLPRNPIFQLGRSHLSFTNVSGQVDTSIVDFLLVWKETTEGYKIYIDTYD